MDFVDLISVSSARSIRKGFVVSAEAKLLKVRYFERFHWKHFQQIGRTDCSNIVVDHVNVVGKRDRILFEQFDLIGAERLHWIYFS